MWLKRVLKALNTVVPKAILEAWKQGERFLPHVLAVAEALPDRLGDQEVRATWTKRSPEAAAHVRENLAISYHISQRRVMP